MSLCDPSFKGTGVVVTKEEESGLGRGRVQRRLVRPEERTHRVIPVTGPDLGRGLVGGVSRGRSLRLFKTSHI